MNERMNESDLKCIRKPTRSRLSLSKQIQPLSRVKSLDGSWVRGLSPVGREKVYGGKDLIANCHYCQEAHKPAGAVENVVF